MKTILITTIMLIAAATATAQYNIHAAVGKSLNSVAATLQIGAGIRVGPVAYFEGQIKSYSQGYPYLAAGALIGAAHSWNNRAMHELTTIFYIKADWVMAANAGYKEKPPVPFGFGIRHYVYRFMVGADYQHNQIRLNIGYSIGDLFR